VKQTAVIVALLFIAALLPLVAVPVALFALAVAFVVIGIAPAMHANAQPLAFVSLTTTRAPPSR
jgi:hypothetical protein